MSAALTQVRRPLIAAIILIVLGLVASTNAFWMLTATSAVVLYILIASFNIVYGYAGLLSLFHTALYGVGAYTAVVLEARLDLSFWITLPIAMLAAFVFSMLIALPTARLGGIFLAIATLGAGIGAEEVFLKWQSVTGGVNGFGGIAPPSFFGVTLFGGDITYYWLVAVCALVTFEILTRTTESRLGRRFVALRESTLDTQSVGINPFYVRVVAFGISGLFAGLAGTLLAHLTLFITATSFSLHRVIEVLIVTMIGGAGTVFGPIVGVVALVGFQELAARVLDLSVVLGIGIVLLNIYAPRGLVGFYQRKRRQLAGAVTKSAETAPAIPKASPLDTAHGEHRLVVRGVDVVFGGVRALADIDIELRSGHVFGLIGPNGAGKTTCVNVISGHVTPTSGTVELDGTSLLDLPPYEVARRGVVRTFQATRLVPSFDLLTNVMMGRDRFGQASLAEQVFHLGRSRRDDEEARTAAMSLLDSLGIAEHALRTAADVPYGIRRRAEIAKALAVDPRFLLLDEPGAGLSGFERAEVAAAIKAVAKLNIGILVIDHNIGFVTDVCDEITVLAAGAVIASGDAEEVLSHKDVVKAYLGEAEVVET